MYFKNPRNIQRTKIEHHVGSCFSRKRSFTLSRCSSQICLFCLDGKIKLTHTHLSLVSFSITLHKNVKSTEACLRRAKICTNIEYCIGLVEARDSLAHKLISTTCVKQQTKLDMRDFSIQSFFKYT